MTTENKTSNMPKILAVAAILAIVVAIFIWRMMASNAVISAVNLKDPSFGGAGCEAPYCQVSTGSEKEVVVAGDSQARMLYAGLKQELGEADTPFSIFDFGTTCNPYLSADNAGCTAELDRYLNYVDEKQVETLVVSSRWIGFEPSLSVEDRGQKIAQHTIALLEDDKMASVRDIIFVFPFPEFENGLHPDVCAKMAAEDETIDCARENVDSFLPQRKLARQIIDALRDQMPKRVSLHVENPFRVLCSEAPNCTQTIDGKSIYSDAQHLSVEGSKFLVSNWRYDWGS